MRVSLGKQERIQLILKGERADRIPYSVWTHFPGLDLEPYKLAEATYNFYKLLDLDFIKTMSNGLFSVEDWGCQCDYSEVTRGGVAKVTRYAVQVPRDWERIGPLNIHQGALGRELISISHLSDLTKGEVPILVTVFSPLTTAYKLSRGKVVDHMKSSPEKVKQALEEITSTTIKFAKRALELGCVGVYFATQVSTYDKLTEEEYAEFGVIYDKKVLNSIKSLSWFNVLHIHGENIMFDLVKDYPVNAISWHVWETNPTICTFLHSTDKCIVGGLQRYHITQDLKEELYHEVEDAIQLTEGKKLFLAPGCVIRAPFNFETLLYLKGIIVSAFVS